MNTLSPLYLPLSLSFCLPLLHALLVSTMNCEGLDEEEINRNVNVDTYTPTQTLTIAHTHVARLCVCEERG